MPDIDYAEKRITAKTLSEEDCRSIIEDMRERFVSSTTTSDPQNNGRGKNRLIDKIRLRRLHFYNLPDVDPSLPEPYHDGHKYQSVALQTVAREYTARLTENKFVIRVDPLRATASERGPHSRLQTVLNSGIRLTEEREGIDIQRSLAEGAVQWCYGVLHWSKADHLWPAVPEYEYLDELPRGDDGQVDRKAAKRYRRNREFVAESNEAKHRRYRETDESLRERRLHDQARAGFPWWVETPHPESFYFLPDRSMANGMALCLLVREVGLLDYAKKLAQDGIVLSVNEANSALAIYGEQDAPSRHLPSGDGWKRRLYIAQLWTRDEFYELCTESEGGTDWLLVKSAPHPYEMPPFALVPGMEHNEADPALAYEPMLEGMYRLKPTFDRTMSLMHTVAESIALPFYYLRSVKDGAPKLDEKGGTLTFTRNAALAMKPPDGYEIAQLEYEMNPAFVESVRVMAADYEEAKPNTGFAEIGATTQPWTARLEQQQANVEPKMVLNNIARAITVMARNMAMVMSKPADEGGFGEPIAVYARMDSGDINANEVISIEPDEIKSLNVYVDIKPQSAAEQITLEEHGRALLADPNVMLTPVEFIKDYEGKADAEDVYTDRLADFAFRTYALPGLIRQKMAQRIGSRFVLGMNGEFVGPDGATATPEQVLAANGVQPQQQGVVNPVPGGQPTPQMPQMGQLSAPNTIPIAGPTA